MAEHETQLVLADGEVVTPAEVEETGGQITVGQWYWWRETPEAEAQFRCVTHIGSNYYRLEDHWGSGSVRVHANVFAEQCTSEPNADAIIANNVERCRVKVNGLLGRVKELTASLSIGPTAALGHGGETQALALRSKEVDLGEYTKALTTAKAETLPTLFKEIRNTHEAMAAWMTAQVVPMKAQASGLGKHIEAIDERIFSVSLYAGLSEDVVRIRDGEAAALGEKLRLIQRRCYMDEECLAAYEAGGMDIFGLEDFDRWLARRDNFDRLLPFQRCLVAFRVRRHEKQRPWSNYVDIMRNMKLADADKRTFLYIRNGAQLHRMHTMVDFGAQLFPDLDHVHLRGKLWVLPNSHGDGALSIITDDRYQDLLEQRRVAEVRHKEELRSWKEQRRLFKEALKTKEARRRAKKAGRKQPCGLDVDMKEPYPWPPHGPERELGKGYEPYDRTSVYYDDATAKIAGDIHEHNRLALILQGLLDRSPVLHPHPPWQLWTDDGFASAIELVYDASRALTPGEAPDFEAYRTKLSATIQPGSITLGQETAWLRVEADKENNRRHACGRGRYDHNLEFYRPHGNPGPGKFGRVVRMKPRVKQAVFEWERERSWRSESKDSIRCAISVPVEQLFHVDAYRPGDFKMFFADPRTRADYLQWAPLLIEAEEYHAGNREVQEPPTAPRQKRESSWEGQLRYRRRQDVKRLLGKPVRNRYEITTKGQKHYAAGMLWVASHYSDRGKLSISGLNEDGTPVRVERYVSGMDPSDLELAHDTTLAPEKPAEEDDE